jgi:hypothetical protein
MQSIAEPSRSKLHTFESQQLANTAWACANMSFHDTPLLEAIASAAILNLKNWQTQDL